MVFFTKIARMRWSQSCKTVSEMKKSIYVALTIFFLSSLALSSQLDSEVPTERKFEGFPVIKCDFKLSTEDLAKLMTSRCLSLPEEGTVDHPFKEQHQKLRSKNFGLFCLQESTQYFGQRYRRAGYIFKPIGTIFEGPIEPVASKVIENINQTLTKNVNLENLLSEIRTSRKWKSCQRLSEKSRTRKSDEEIWLPLFEKSFSDEKMLSEINNWLYTEKLKARETSSSLSETRKSHNPNEIMTAERAIKYGPNNGRYFTVKFNNTSSHIITGEPLVRKMHPEDQIELSLPDEYYQVHALYGGSGGSSTRSFNTMDDSSLKNKKWVSKKLGEITNCLNREISYGRVKFKKAKDLPNLLTKRCGGENYSIFIPRMETMKIDAREPISSGLTLENTLLGESVLPWFNDELKALKTGINTSAQLGEMNVVDLDPKIISHLTRLEGWKESDLIPVWKSYQKAMSNALMSEDTNDVVDLLRGKGGDLHIAINLYKTRSYSIPYFINGEKKIKILGIYDIQETESAFRLEDRVRKLIISSDTLELAKIEKEEFFSLPSTRMRLAKHLEILKSDLEDREKRVILKAAIEEILDVENNAFKTLEKAARKIFSSRILNSRENDDLIGCSVVKISASKRILGKIFRQKGVTTIVRHNGQEKWITPAHVVFGADAISGICGSDGVDFDVEKIDFARDVAVLTPKFTIRAKSLSTSEETKNIQPLMLMPDSDSFSIVPELYNLEEKKLNLEKNFVGSPYFGVENIIKMTDFGVRPGMSGAPILNQAGAVVAIATHLSTSIDETLALPINEFFREVKLPDGVQLDRSIELLGDHLKTFDKLTLATTSIVVEDNCGRPSFSPVSQWQKVGLKTDWGGSSEGTIKTGDYYLERVDGGYSRFFSLKNGACSSGVKVDGKTLVGLYEIWAQNTFKIDSVINLLQVIDGRFDTDFSSQGAWSYSIWKETSNIKKICKDMLSLSDLHVGTMTNSWRGLKINGENAGFSEKSTIFTKSSYQDGPPSFSCNEEEQITLNLKSGHSKIESPAQVRISANRVSGEIGFEKCSLEIDQEKDFYSWRSEGPDFNANFYIETYPSPRLRVVFSDLNPNCFLNPDSTTRLQELVWEFPQK